MSKAKRYKLVKGSIKNSPNHGYIRKLKEWQENQFNPGYFTGSNMHPILTNPGRPGLMGWTLVIVSIVFTLLTVIIVLFRLGLKNPFDKIIIISISLCIYSLQFIVGLRFIIKGRQQYGKRFKKKHFIMIIVTLGALLVISLSAFIVYNSNNNNGEITITSPEQIDFYQRNGNNYVYIKSLDKTFNCSIENYLKFWGMAMDVRINSYSSEFYKVYYTWNKFNPQKGEINSITETVIEKGR